MTIRMVKVRNWKCDCGRFVKGATVKGDDTGRAYGSCSRCGWVRVKQVTVAEYPQIVDGAK